MTGGDQFRTRIRSKLNPAVRSPTAQETKKFTAIALAWLVEHIMKNFVYNFGGEDRKQEDGGPMGDELTQAMSRYIGNEYDEIFLEKTEELYVDIELYERYVDDQNIAGWSIGRNVEFCRVDGKMKIKSDEDIENDTDKRDDELFMKELRKIADTVMDIC